VRLWDAEAGTELKALTGHSDGVSAVASCTLGGRVVVISGALDKTVRLWAVQAGTSAAGPSSDALPMPDHEPGATEHDHPAKKQKHDVDAGLLAEARKAHRAAEERARSAEAQLAEARRATDLRQRCTLSAASLPLAQFGVRLTRTGGQSFEVAQLWTHGQAAATPITLDAELVRNLWSGGGVRGRANRFALRRVEAINNAELAAAFCTKVRNMETQRQSGGVAFNRPDWGADRDGEKAALLAQLKAKFLPLDGLTHQNLLLVFHGCAIGDADLICSTGLANVAYRDNGWFGQGIYATSSAEYAARYASGELKPNSTHRTNAQGEYVVIACWAVPGMCYPLSRKADYTGAAAAHSKFYAAPGRQAKPLVNQFQSHYVAVGANDFEIVDGVRNKVVADYDEIVFRESAQLIPAYRMYFKAP
jgi:hypothetical protein